MRYTKKLALCAICTAIAMALSLLENLVPVAALVPIPGIKLGLANIVTMFALYFLGLIPALAILVVRCILTALFAGSITSFLFSLIGGCLALLVMRLLKPLTGHFCSLFGVSIAGAAAHNCGQILAAIVTLRSVWAVSYLPPLLLASLLTGTLTALIASPLFLSLDKVLQKNRL